MMGGGRFANSGKEALAEFERESPGIGNSAKGDLARIAGSGSPESKVSTPSKERPTIARCVWGQLPAQFSGTTMPRGHRRVDRLTRM